MVSRGVLSRGWDSDVKAMAHFYCETRSAHPKLHKSCPNVSQISKICTSNERHATWLFVTLKCITKLKSAPQVRSPSLSSPCCLGLHPMQGKWLITCCKNISIQSVTSRSIEYRQVSMYMIYIYMIYIYTWYIYDIYDIYIYIYTW